MRAIFVDHTPAAALRNTKSGQNFHPILAHRGAGALFKANASRAGETFRLSFPLDLTSSPTSPEVG